MDSSFARVLAYGTAIGVISAFVGGYQCIEGHIYSVAAQHEATAVGRVVKVNTGKSTSFQYVFSINGVAVDDYGGVCATPLEQNACFNHGKVLVYYSHEPYSNSRLEDFAVASSNAYRIGIPVLAIGFFLAVLPGTALFVFARGPVSREKAANWPVTEGTIQSVGRVFVNVGRGSYSVDVGDFTYQVDGEYCSGRLKISSSFSTHDRSPRDLVNQKIEVRYNPRDPEKYPIPQEDLNGFLLDAYDEPFGEDVGPTDLNVDKV